jgi:probable H4MPT-linked C1 transfer pathway protein
MQESSTEIEKSPRVWGLDIGGANIKMCLTDGHSMSQPFPMWLRYQQLAESIQNLIQQTGTGWIEGDWAAVTMTGELADCFRSRSQGVRYILDQLSNVFPPQRCRVYAVGGSWLTFEQAANCPWDVAASNWHALAKWCLAQNPWGSLDWHAVIDIGSTTVDILPTAHGQLLTQAKTDRQRMQVGQLVYTGMQRTPVAAVVQSLLVAGCRCPVMAERFATMDDVNLALQAVSDKPDDFDSADGRPRTRQFAMERLARMVGEDLETLGPDEIELMASQIALAQTQQINAALLRNLVHAQLADDAQSGRSVARVLVSGHGRPLIERLKLLQSQHGGQQVEFVYLDQFLPPETVRCAPALAVAMLAQESLRISQ